MADNNETVEQVCEKMKEPSIYKGRLPASFFDGEFCEFADRILAAHKRELAVKDNERLTVSANYESVIAAKDRIIDAKDAEIARLRNELSRVQDITGDCRKCEECGDESCPWFGEPDGCNNREAREKFLRGELVNPIKKRDALIKELANALECAVSGFSREVVTYGEAYALVAKARRVVK